MNNKRENKTKEIALCGMLAALSIVIMLAGSVIQVGIYAAPVMAALAIVVAETQYGAKTALLCYAATAAVGLILLPDKELALFYTVFGWYPALLPRLRKIKSVLIRYAVEFVIYLVMILSLYCVIMKLLGLDTGIAESEMVLNLFLLVIGGMVFLMLDSLYLRIGEILVIRLRKITGRQ